MLNPSQLTLIKRCQQQGEGVGVEGDELLTIKNLPMTQQSESGRGRVKSRWTPVSGWACFQAQAGDLGLRHSARGHAATTAMVTVPSAARCGQSLCPALSSLRWPSGRRTSRQLLAAPHDVIFFLLHLRAHRRHPRVYLPHLLRKKIQTTFCSQCSYPPPLPLRLCLRRGVPAQEAFPLAPQTEGMCLPAD